MNKHNKEARSDTGDSTSPDINRSTSSEGDHDVDVDPAGVGVSYLILLPTGSVLEQRYFARPETRDDDSQCVTDETVEDDSGRSQEMRTSWNYSESGASDQRGSHQCDACSSTSPDCSCCVALSCQLSLCKTAKCGQAGPTEADKTPCQCDAGTQRKACVRYRARADLAKAIVLCCERSWTFCLRMNSFLRLRMAKQSGVKSRLKKSDQQGWYDPAATFDRSTRQLGCAQCLIDVTLVVRPQLHIDIDYAWGNRLEILSFKWSLLKDAMAWLSTLGGGHSALGDYQLSHADVAGQLSIKQFRIALSLGDEGLEYRCRLYYSLSLIQKSQLRKAKLYIRAVHRAARDRLRDERLVNMCLGVWSRLQYVYSKRRGRSGGASESEGIV